MIYQQVAKTTRRPCWARRVKMHNKMDRTRTTKTLLLLSFRRKHLEALCPLSFWLQSHFLFKSAPFTATWMTFLWGGKSSLSCHSGWHTALNKASSLSSLVPLKYCQTGDPSSGFSPRCEEDVRLCTGTHTLSQLLFIYYPQGPHKQTQTTFKDYVNEKQILYFNVLLTFVSLAESIDHRLSQVCLCHTN